MTKAERRASLMRSMRRNELVKVWDHHGFLNHLAVDLIAELQTALDSIPEKYRNTAHISSETYTEYHTVYHTVTLFYNKPEDDETLGKRVDEVIMKENARRKAEKKRREENDAKEYERLKKKFEGKAK